MTIETIPSKSTTKTNMPLWFWILLAVASALILSLSAFYFSKYSRLTIAAKEVQTPLIQQRDLLLQQEDLLQSNWLKTLNPLAKKIQGDLIWSSRQQKGFMRFANLPKLSAHQRYHLWIYDLENRLEEPISATRFQADPHIKKEYLVEILPEKRVEKPYKFILKLESEAQPDQILLLAQP